MSTVTVNRRINLDDLPGIEASARWDGTTCEVDAPGVDLATLQAAVDVAPDADAVEQARQTNRLTLEDRARQALDANKTFLANTSPTNAQVVAQVKLLTRECSALIRLALSELDAAD